MAVDGAKSDATPVKLDAEGLQLQLDAEKAKLAAAIADAEAAKLTRLLPTPPADAPKGQVTLGDKAGAFGPWRAHQVIDAVARQIAAKVLESGAGRVLIVEDRALLPGEWTAHQVRDAIDRAGRQLAGVTTQATEMGAALAAFTPEAGRRPAGTELTSAAGGKPGAGAGSANALGAAIDLVGLLRTDYTITATPVTATSSELATLVAAHLGPKAVPDGFGLLRGSDLVHALTETLTARDAAALALSHLDVRLAPMAEELADLRRLAADREQAWAGAVTEGKGSVAIEALRRAADDAAGRVTGLSRAVAPARAFSAQVHEVVADIDAGLATLTRAPAGGEAPIVTAVRRERLRRAADEGGATHVLYTSLDAVAADAVTRRSILGVSGLLRFLSAGTASWLLLDAASGDLARGGQVSLADTMTYGLDSGKLRFAATVQTPVSEQADLDDPLARLETGARVVVLILVVALFLIGAVALLAFVTR